MVDKLSVEVAVAVAVVVVVVVRSRTVDDEGNSSTVLTAATSLPHVSAQTATTSFGWRGMFRAGRSVAEESVARSEGGCKAGQWPVVFGIMYMGLTLAVSKLAVHASRCLPAGSLRLPARNKKKS